MHLQNKTIEDWREATNEIHLEAMLTSPGTFEPSYFAYLKSDRPDVINRYLKIWRSGGNYALIKSRD